MPPKAPPGYVSFGVQGARVVGLAPLEGALREALDAGTFYDYAVHHPNATPLTGRGTAYAVPLPDETTRVVVRRSRHGGALAALSGEHFVGATRAPRELESALHLERGGVPTPQVVAYATYPSPGPLPIQRADVLTREIVGGRDLVALLAERPDSASRGAALEAVAFLLAQLARAGARHPDLNLRNIVLAPRDGTLTAWAIDVDRVVFAGKDVGAANYARMARSARKLKERGEIDISELELEQVRARSLEIRLEGRGERT